MIVRYFCIFDMIEIIPNNYGKHIPTLATIT